MAIRGFDETYEEFERREKFEQYFGSYSAGVRKQLMSKQIDRPENLYDIFYIKVRHDLLAKNVSTSKLDLDDKSEAFRKKMVSSNVPSAIDVELASEEARKGMLAKNKLLNTTLKLDQVADDVREGMLARNVESNKGLESNADISRDGMLSKNVSSENTIDDTSKLVRDSMISSNIKKQQDLEGISKKFRTEDLSKNVSQTNDLEVKSETYRAEDLNKNVPINIDLEKNSQNLRSNNLLKNEKINSDLETDSISYRKDDLSNNVPVNTDLEKSSELFRKEDLSNNIPINTDLEKSSETFRKEDLLNNISINTDLEKSSESFRKDDLSNNIPINTDLEKSSELFRKEDLLNNIPIDTDLEKSSESFRKEDLSNNIPINTNLEKSSELFRKEDLSNNILINTDLEKDSVVFRNDDLANNVEKITNLEDDSINFREEDLSKNVEKVTDLENDSSGFRKEDLSKNVPGNLTIDTYDDNERDEQLAKNVPNSSDIENDSEQLRDDLLAKNVPIVTNLEIDSEVNRKEDLSKNVQGSLTIDSYDDDERKEELAKNVAGTLSIDTYDDDARAKLLAKNNGGGKGGSKGDGDLLEDSSQFRNDLLASNVERVSNLLLNSNPFRHKLLAKNTSKVLGVNVTAFGTSKFIGVSNLWAIGLAIREATKLKDKAIDKFFGEDLEELYGITPGKGKNVSNLALGIITEAIQIHNFEQNIFSLNIGHNGGISKIGQSILLSHNSDGFQKLLTSSDKGFGQDNGLEGNYKKQTNTTPAKVITKLSNNGNGVVSYLGGEPDSLLKKGRTEIQVGSAESMVSQTEPSDVLNTEDFVQRNRGVAYIVDTIKNNRDITIAKNLDVQGQAGSSKSFVIGLNSDKTIKRACSRYTIKNPYAPEGAGTLALRFKNYANGEVMSFPPYISTFQHTDNANWNSEVFLGRPEPIYTYANGTRDGSITFFVLTDYAQKVDIGNYCISDDNGTRVEKITEDFEGKDFVSNMNSKNLIKEMEAEKKKIKLKIAELNAQNTVVSTPKYISSDVNDVNLINPPKTATPPDTAGLKREILYYTIKMNRIEEAITEIQTAAFVSMPNRDYLESDKLGKNIYELIMQGEQLPKINGDIIESQPANTVKLLSNMKKGMLFQPAYFSGSKADFVSRMEFLSKMTKPARSNKNFGFSFINPPICHIWLGDWLNHDIVTNSISYSYDDVPWTIDGGRVQPMWASVTINFNIVGKWGGKGDTPLATDKGGFYSKTFN